jgi:hypothetical protein
MGATACHDHLRAIVRQINGEAGCMPSEVRVHADQHDFLTGKANGLICTVESVPCYIDSGVTDGTPVFKVAGGADQTTTYASSSGDATF